MPVVSYLQPSRRELMAPCFHPVPTQIEEAFSVRRLRVVGPVKTSEAARSQRRLALDRPYITTFCHGAPLKLHRFAFSLRELKGDRRASLLVGSGINNDGS